MATIASLDVTFLVLLGAWSVFAWALGPAMQASLIQVGGAQAMLAMALGISGLYGGSAAGAAIGGLLIDQLGTVALLFVAAFFVAAAFFLIRFKEEPNAWRVLLKQ